MVESELGEFSTHTRVGQHVVKRLHSHHPAGARFLDAAASTDASVMEPYIDTLRHAGVHLPNELCIVGTDPLIIQHRWVPGPTLLDAHCYLSEFTASIVHIGEWIVRLECSDARIDANLANFCVHEGRPVLIDVLPPLIPSRAPQPHTLFEKLFAALCFDTATSLDALVGYAMRSALRAGRPGAAAEIESGTRGILRTPPGNFPARWFAARRVLATRATRGEINTDLVAEFFTLTSVLRFRQLTERARQAQINYVDRRMQELDL